MQTPYIDLFEGFNAIYNKYELEVVENARLFSLEIPNVAILLIAGGSASGTTTLAQALQRKINNEYRSDFGRDLVGLISMDHYYKNRNASDLNTPDSLINHDHPDMLDIGLLAKHLQELRGGRSVEMPVYNWGGPGKPGYREPDKIQLFEACPLIIVEGIFAMDKRLQVYADTKVFVYADEEKSRQRRIRRDIIERGKTEEGSNVKWYHTVLPMFKQHVMPRIVDADMLIFNNGDLPNEFLE